jgi:hypothetical protein
MHPQKRKRTVVSYAQLDPLADLLNDDEDITVLPNDESSDDESDNDDRTYSRRNVCIFGPVYIRAVRLTVRLRKSLKRPRKRRPGILPSNTKKPRSLSHSWTYLPNFVT